MSSASPNSVMGQAAQGVPYNPDDYYIAVMGVTGSGKSTFISHLVGGGATIGHDLESCTSEIELFSFQYNERTIHLIDTPGFDDTYRTDSDVLKDIAYWLNLAYQQNIRLSGIIYLHPINNTRMSGSAYKNLRMFHKLCGDSNLKSVVLGTTMWANVGEDEGHRRQEQLKSHPDFWGEMVEQGSVVFRHDDSRVSAMNLVTYILDQRLRTVLQIQREMVDNGKRLDETSAGMELEKELHKQRQLFEKRLLEAQEDMKAAVEEGNKRAIEAAVRQQEQFQKRLDQAVRGSQELKASFQQLLEQKEEEMRRVLQSQLADRERRQETQRLIKRLQGQIAEKEKEAEYRDHQHRLEVERLEARLATQVVGSQPQMENAPVPWANPFSYNTGMMMNRLGRYSAASMLSSTTTSMADGAFNGFAGVAGGMMGNMAGTMAASMCSMM